MKAQTVMYEGRAVTLIELALLTGHTYACIASRYRKGDRGEQLIRPRDSNGGTKPLAIKDQNKQMAEEAQKRRERRASEVELRRRKREAKRKALADARAAHAQEFGRPLIDASLLSANERREIRKSVLGVQRWLAGDGGLLG